MEEMTSIQKIARQALKAFRNPNGSPSKHNLDVLKSMMGAITAEDLNLSAPPTRDRRSSFPGVAPVTHMEIIECPCFSMAIFIVRKGRKLPLHDHPGMHGFCKVLYGTIEVDMYSRMDSQQHENTNGTMCDSNESKMQKFLFQGKHLFDSDNGVCTVSPAHGNFHSIQAVNGPAAFLDILGPPYSTEEGRDCLYYKECYPVSNGVEQNGNQSNVRYLKEIPCPQEFFCDSQVYRGPVVRFEELMQVSDEE